MSAGLAALTRIVEQARVAESLMATPQARQTCVEIRLAAQGAMACEKNAETVVLDPARKGNYRVAD